MLLLRPHDHSSPHRTDDRTVEVPPDGYISWTAELITAENAQQITGLFSCVDFVISACLTIPDQYSIKEAFFAFSLSVASRCKKKKKDPKMREKSREGFSQLVQLNSYTVRHRGYLK